MDDEDFALQRNKFQYRVSYWPFDELRGSKVPSRFGQFESAVDLEASLATCDGQQFSFSLAEAVLAVANDLIADLAQHVKTYGPELELFQRWLNKPPV